jgi:hypothetical protein
MSVINIIFHLEILMKKSNCNQSHLSSSLPDPTGSTDAARPTPRQRVRKGGMEGGRKGGREGGRVKWVRELRGLLFSPHRTASRLGPETLPSPSSPSPSPDTSLPPSAPPSHRVARAWTPPASTSEEESALNTVQALALRNSVSPSLPPALPPALPCALPPALRLRDSSFPRFIDV